MKSGVVMFAMAVAGANLFDGSSTRISGAQAYKPPKHDQNLNADVNELSTTHGGRLRGSRAGGRQLQRTKASGVDDKSVEAEGKTLTASGQTTEEELGASELAQGRKTMNA